MKAPRHLREFQIVQARIRHAYSPDSAPDLPDIAVRSRVVGYLNCLFGNISCFNFFVGRGARSELFEQTEIEAVRLRPERLCVIARGKVVAEREKRDMALSIEGRPETVSRRHKR